MTEKIILEIDKDKFDNLMLWLAEFQKLKNRQQSMLVRYDKAFDVVRTRSYERIDFEKQIIGTMIAERMLDIV